MSSRRRPPLKELAKGFKDRTLTTARLGTKIGLAALKKQINPDAERAAADEEEAVARAIELVEQLDGLKGLVMKFGQMASYLNPNLPPRAQRVLAQLQSNSQPMEYGRIAELVEAELGDSPEALFDSFETEPFAAASIGQVHRAVYDGTPVAVKVQYPGVEDALESDLKTMGRMVRVGMAMTAADTKELVEELRDRIIEECDYQLEASNQELIGGLVAGRPHVHVPRVVRPRSARRVLTTELARGRGFYDFIDECSREQRDAASRVLFDTSLRCIFADCVFNADPHPGNYLFAEDGTVVFLDFGCVKWFSAEFIDRWKRISLAVLDGDRRAFEDGYVEAGFVPKPDKFDWDYQWDVIRYIYEPAVTKGTFTYTHEWVNKSYNLLVFKNPNRNRTNLPRDWLFVNRIQWGSNSVLAHLGATGEWGPRLREILETPTRPARDPKKS